MTAAAAVFEAGVYDDMPEDAYHADPVPNGSLSSTGARKLLPPGCPAKYRYERDDPPERKAVFDFGAAAHSLVLGRGKPLAWLEAEDWRTKAAKEWRDAVRAEGHLPLLRDEYNQVQAMADAIREHPLAGPLLDAGVSEQSYFWLDQEYETWRRARLDSSRQGSGRLIVTDYKTTSCAEPTAFARSCANYGYHQQGAWYLDAVIGRRDPRQARPGADRYAPARREARHGQAGQAPGADPARSGGGRGRAPGVAVRRALRRHAGARATDGRVPRGSPAAGAGRRPGSRGRHLAAVPGGGRAERR